MSWLDWDMSYSVKVKKCDDDHRKLFSLIKALHEAMKAGKGAQVLQQILKELADYTKYHFSGEEEMLAKTNYPGLGSHRAQHQQFVKKVEEFRQDAAAGKLAQTIAVSTFLNDWLVNHIKRTDQQYSEHLNANGIS
ncbi:MAG: bacteriohemerythrin [Acidobacteriia bacterium]|nr:bacteriohemerythrin [Terriglobia bacterium]